MPPKTKSSKKLTKHSSPESSWLSKFCRGQDIPDDIKDGLVEHQITSRQVFASITEQDFADMGFVVGQKIMLRREWEVAVVIPAIMQFHTDFLYPFQTPDRTLTRRNQMLRDDDIFSKVEQKKKKTDGSFPFYSPLTRTRDKRIL